MLRDVMYSVLRTNAKSNHPFSKFSRLKFYICRGQEASHFWKRKKGTDLYLLYVFMWCEFTLLKLFYLNLVWKPGLSSSYSICRMTQSPRLTVSWWLPALNLAPNHHHQDVLGWPFMDVAPRPLAFGSPCGFGCEVEPLMGMERGWQKWDKVFPGVLRCNKTHNQSVQPQGCLFGNCFPCSFHDVSQAAASCSLGQPLFISSLRFVHFFFLPDYSVQKC